MIGPLQTMPVVMCCQAYIPQGKQMCAKEFTEDVWVNQGNWFQGNARSYTFQGFPQCINSSLPECLRKMV